jgi:cobalt-zinc-cadmium resistance protein CzcA
MSCFSCFSTENPIRLLSKTRKLNLTYVSNNLQKTDGSGHDKLTISAVHKKKSVNKFIKNIVSFSLKNKGIIFFATAVLIIGGVYSAFNTAIEAFPDVMNTRIIIITQWPGRSAEEVEKFISIPIEVEMNSVPGKTSLRSISLFGLSVVTLMFEDDVDDFTARQNVTNRLMSVDLPDGIKPDIEPPYGPTGEIYRYTLQSKTRDPRDLKTLQDWVIERQLKSVAGVADIVSFGGDVKAFEVSVDPNLLTKYGFTAVDVFNALQKSNVNVGGDVINKNNQAYVVRGLGLVQNTEDIKNIIISNVNGTPVQVKNVAEVIESKKPNLGYVGRDSLTNLVECIIVMRKGENASKVLEGIHNKVDELNNEVLPGDVKIVPFYDRTRLIHYTVGTVTHNLMEGMLLVIFIVTIFMANWRTTVIVSVIIPLSLLFALICMKIKGMSANLLSIGAIDFGIIIDGAVVMVEGLFVVLDHKAKAIGMDRFNKMGKLGLIKNTGGELAKPIFFSKLIIITAMLPIFAFQKVEGKMFSPLAYTLGFALIGSLILSLTLVPVLASIWLKKNVREKSNPFIDFIYKYVNKAFNLTYGNPVKSLTISVIVTIISIGSFKYLGSEFLPQLNEGAIYVRASMPYSSSLSQSIELTEKIRHKISKFAEIEKVLSQTGRPDDGTDATGAFNIELHVELVPHEDWKRKISKEQLINEMQDSLAVFQGINFSFSQPIMDNIEEAVSGVKGSMAVKVYGTDIQKLEQMGDSVYNILKTIKGVDDLGIIHLMGQPEIRIELNQDKMAVYGVATSDLQAVIEMAIGGKAATQLYEGEKKFDIRLRFLPEYRQDETAIGNLLIPTLNGNKIPLKLLANIHTITGPAFVYREANQRFIGVKFSVRGRDLGSTIAEGQEKVNKAFKAKLGKGMKITWQGEFENQERAQTRLSYVVPFSIFIIFLLLFVAFGNFRDAGLVLLNLPFAVIGGIWALHITHINFSISAGVGFIALFGICIQAEVILISIFKRNLHMNMPLDQAIKEGFEDRIRSVLMTALIASLGLLPAAMSTGIGSESQKPLATVVIGGLVSSTILTLLIFPILFKLMYRKRESQKKVR